MDASSMARPMSATSGIISLDQRVRLIFPSSKFSPNETIFCAPNRHGTHLPQDSFRKNSSEFTASSHVATFGVNDQSRAERLRRTECAEQIQLQFQIENIQFSCVWIESAAPNECLPRFVVRVIARQTGRVS